MIVLKLLEPSSYRDYLVYVRLYGTQASLQSCLIIKKYYSGSNCYISCISSELVIYVPQEFHKDIMKRQGKRQIKVTLENAVNRKNGLTHLPILQYF